MCSIKFTGYFTLKKNHFYASSAKYLLIPEL